MAWIVLLLFVVMLCRQLEEPEESTLSIVFDYIIYAIHIHTKADDTNRREMREREGRKKAPTDLDQHHSTLFFSLMYRI